MIAGEDKALIAILVILFLWVLLFAGTPDLHDAIVKRLMGAC